MNEQRTSRQQDPSVMDTQDTYRDTQDKYPNDASSYGSATQRAQGAGTQTYGNTGTEDKTFNLVSVLYHALEGGATYTKYIQDAERDGDNELAQFFRQSQQEERQRAEHAKQLLARRLTPAR